MVGSFHQLRCHGLYMRTRTGLFVCVHACGECRWCSQSSYAFDYRAGVAMFTSLHKYLTYNVAMSCHHCSCPEQYFMFKVTTKISALLHQLFTCFLFLWAQWMWQLIWEVTEGEVLLAKLWFLLFRDFRCKVMSHEHNLEIIHRTFKCSETMTEDTSWC